MRETGKSTKSFFPLSFACLFIVLPRSIKIYYVAIWVKLFPLFGALCQWFGWNSKFTGHTGLVTIIICCSSQLGWSPDNLIKLTVYMQTSHILCRYRDITPISSDVVSGQISRVLITVNSNLDSGYHLVFQQVFVCLVRSYVFIVNDLILIIFYSPTVNLFRLDRSWSTAIMILNNRNGLLAKWVLMRMSLDIDLRLSRFRYISVSWHKQAR